MRLSILLAGLVAVCSSPARAVEVDAIDPSVSACVDFYQYANGGWLARNPVPPAYSSWGTFNEIENRNNDRLLAIARAAAADADAAPGTPEWLVGRFFRAATDEEAIEALGLDPLRADLDAIAAIEDMHGLLRLLRGWHREGLPLLFALAVRPDLKDETRSLAYAHPGGLGLPNRDYYLREDADSQAQREAYRAHIARMLVLAGGDADEAAAQARAIVALETRLARMHLPREQLRDPERSYHPVTLAQADADMPVFAWKNYFDDIGAPAVREFSLAPPAFFGELARALAEEPIALWRDYLRWHLLRASAPFLHRAVADEAFAFYGRTLKGQKEQRRREIRAIEQMNERLGEPLGRLFVARHFPPPAKARMQELIGHLQTALRLRLEAVAWLGEDSRAEALAKWAAFSARIGYPERWRDYGSVRLDVGRHLANVRALRAFAQAQELARLGRPVDRSEWAMSPQQVNAYYNPLWNEVVFPAGILQPPIFDSAADDAANYGAIGAVIGHELLHGFDDAGSRFDARGRLRMWWSAADRAEFERRTQGLVRQADEFVAGGELKLNGKVSLGENIADLGGLTIAYHALVQALADREPGEVDGYTPQQRFFLGWAQVWRRNWTAQALQMAVHTGPHAPAKFRVNGPLANMPEFHAAFECKPGDPMVRAEGERVAIW